MKTRTFVAILIFYLSVMVIADSCVTGKKASSSKEDEVLCGTWVNLDYDKTWKYGKIVIKPDGSYDEYDKSESVGGGKLGYAITEKWTDSVRVPTWYYLARIDSTGNVFEYVDSGLDFPTEIDLNHPNYAIHYRNK
jgi:hypothetical protein